MYAPFNGNFYAIIADLFIFCNPFFIFYYNFVTYFFLEMF